MLLFGPGSSSGKELDYRLDSPGLISGIGRMEIFLYSFVSRALGYGLDGPGSIPGVGGVEIFLHSFVSRLALGSTQPPIK